MTSELELGQGAADRAKRAAQRIQALDAANPTNLAKDKPKKADPSMTFEVYYRDYSALGDDFVDAARLLARARREEDEQRELGRGLKLDSRSIWTGDWIVFAENEDTKAWLYEFFDSDDFIQEFRAVLVSSRGQLVKYSIEVQYPDSLDENLTIMKHVLNRFRDIGYVRYADEKRKFKCKETQSNYDTIKSTEKKEQFFARGVSFIKFIYFKMSMSAHLIFQEEQEKVNVDYGVRKLKIRRLTILPGDPQRPGREENNTQNAPPLLALPPTSPAH